MKTVIKKVLVVFTLTILGTSCSKLTPAGFWTNFHSDLILMKESDQGPWGGHRVIEWESKIFNSFTSKELIDFAANNNWTIADSILIDTLTKQTSWKFNGDDYSLYIFKENILPKLKSNDNKVFVFKTTWISIEPGNTNETYTNGFVILNSLGTELRLYHYWGE